MVSSLKQNGFCASSMRKIAACLFLMLAFSGQSAPAQELHYRFDDAVGATASDSSGNGHIGALTNGPGWIPGRFGSAVSFDGTNDHVATAFAANLPQWSVAFWVRSPASPAAGPANGPVHRERSFAISWDHPAAAFRGSAALSVAGTWYGASFGTLDPDTWYHLAATYDGETLSVYKNGALVATNVDPSGPPDAEPATLAVGKHAGADEFFDGEVDDLYVYASVLTLAEIQGLMAGPANPDVTAPQISNLAGSTTSTAATISWTTNEPASSRLSYGPTTALGTTISDAAFALSHSYTLTGLTPDTPYFYEIEVQDPSLNATIDNNGGLFHTVTTQQSEPAPTISNVQVTNLAASSATITWTTNVAASSAVDWGPTTSLGSNKASAVPVTSHSITLTGLTGTSTYFFTVSSTGAGGTTTDDNGGLRYSFTTPQMSSNLILYHRYDEAIGSVAMDSSGNGINGTLANGPVWIAGQHGAALSFDGVNDRVTTAFADHLPAWSVAFWVRSPASPASGTANGPVHRENNFAISWNHPAAAFRGAAAMSVGGNWYAASFGVLVPDTWYHLAATYDGETLSAYKNGLLVTANTAPSGPADPHAGTLSIGKHAVIDSYFAGDVDDLQVHGRALSTAEIVGVMAGPADPDVIPPQISGAAHSVAGTTATIAWVTNEPADSRVNFGTTTGLGQSSSSAVLALNHSIALAGLASGQTYFYEIVSQDPSGNSSTDNNGGAYYTFSIAAAVPAPAISNVQVINVTADTATVTWTTDVASSSSVDYGVNPGLSQNDNSPTPVTSHSLTLTGLANNTNYVFRVSSTSAGGTTTDDNGGALYGFMTQSGQTQVIISNIQATEITGHSATISWQTNLPVHASVERNVQPAYFLCPPITFEPQDDPHYCTVWDQIPSVTPVVRLADLQPNTTYYFRVRTAQSDGGEIISQIAPAPFTTLDSVGLAVDAQIAASSDDAHEAPGGALVYSHTSSTISAGVPTLVPVTGGWRWTGLGIPTGATVTEAWVELNQNDLGTGFVSKLALEDAQNPATFSSLSTPFNRWASRTAFEIRWPWPHTRVLGTWIRTSSLVSGVQELVDKYGGIDSLVLMEQGIEEEPFRRHRWSAFDLSPALGATLHIQYADPSDTIPPIISGVGVSPTSTAATITWVTNEPSNSRVNYGVTTALGSTRVSSAAVTNHSVTLDSLNAATPYFFEVQSQDAGLNIGTDNNGGAYYAFATDPIAPPVEFLNYRFDTGAGNVAFDSSGNGLNGSLVNAPAWIPGQLGSALSFDGAGAYVDSGVSTDLAEWTVAFWVRSPSAPARGAANGPVHRERNFAISWDHPAATFRGAAAMRAGGNWYAASFGSLAADTWYHLTATYDGETLKAYTNGVLVTANASPAGAPDPEVATMTVGRHAKSQSFFAGDVDELRIYQRALTPAEIDALTP